MGAYGNDENLVYTDFNSSGCNECGCESLNVELSDKVSQDNYSKGVSFTTFGNKVKVTYDGLLAKSGSDKVFAFVSYGDNNNWQNSSTYLMNSTNQQKYELNIPAQNSKQVNVAFKDSANNWDNNSGKNYSYYIQ